MKNLKKNLKTIKEFINNSIGEWKSIRSTHTLSFQEFENTNSNISISYLNINNPQVSQLIDKFNSVIKPSFAIKILWKASSEWSYEEKSEEKRAIFIFEQKDNKSGIIFKNKGYAELIRASAEYFIDEIGYLNIISKYSSTISEEKIWFLSENIRSRYSLIKSKSNNIILQTSHATEIRRVVT